MVVPRVRIELTTRGSSGHCSTTELPRHIRYGFRDLSFCGYGARQRTFGTSYFAPRRRQDISSRTIRSSLMVGVPGIEPGTSALSVLRSNQLSYTPSFWCGDIVPEYPYISNPRDPSSYSATRSFVTLVAYEINQILCDWSVRSRTTNPCIRCPASRVRLGSHVWRRRTWDNHLWNRCA